MNREKYKHLSEYWYLFYRDKFSYPHIRGILLAFQIELAILAHHEHILSVGCGRGIVEDHLSKRGYTVVALDMSVPLIQLVKQHMHALKHLIIARAEYLPFRDKVFDIVWTEGLLEHYQQQWQVIMLNEQVRIANNVLVAVPAYDAHFLCDEIPYPDEHWEQLCGQYGDTVSYEYYFQDGSRRLVYLIHVR